MATQPVLATSTSLATSVLTGKGSTTEQIAQTHTDELVIALCGPIGSPLHAVAEEIQRMIKDTFGYDKAEIIRLSDFIRDHASKVQVEIPANDSFERITAQIDAGNKLREEFGLSILAELAVEKIRFEREEFKQEIGAQNYAPRRICHIIDSVKNKEELALLKLVYRDMLYVMGVFSPLSVRESNIAQRNHLKGGDVHTLIDRDSGEESKAGQTVSDTFPQSDFFLRIDKTTDSETTKRVERFLHLILGTKVITPTSAESAMYAAAMASAHSGCLSRQVGAAVTDSNEHVLSTGWNDVPKFGGGLYLEGNDDSRCWNHGGGKCFNDEEKQFFANELVESLKDIIPTQSKQTAKEILRKSGKLGGLIEFSRAIHAEMHAILSAGRIAGDKLVGGKIFVTTYPCHSCARHIIAAGIKEVYYIEPYRKSLAIKLHGDAISELELDSQKVRVLAYDGVAPSKFLSLFRVPSNSRKESGKLIRIPLKKARPRIEKSLESLPSREAIVVASLMQKKLLPQDEQNGQTSSTAT
ncbi:deoxycytidylate deaminase [Undibacterium sp. FT147W]|uniref:Deoxycytidylate deaminase n=1 Tax=Undibacterium rivi TaxID=2828729 RepID=A0ABS5GXV7_9BURK|nr:anti-phage dCTP deaminase [Undibacterium rivi]MBR7791280.1 deoxycytidylate deaminase [Undibacterium rivi]